MSALRDQTRYTEAEYLALERESDIKHEFIDGQIYAMSGASVSHNRVVGNIFASIHTQLQKSSCSVFIADMRVRVSASGNYTYPDVTVVCGEELFAEDEMIATLLNPTLIIEVLSASTEGYDRGKKFHEYQKLSSLQDYVLVAQDEPLIECFSRADGDAWLLTKAEGLDAALSLPSIEATLRLAEVYERVTFEDEGQNTG